MRFGCCSSTGPRADETGHGCSVSSKQAGPGPRIGGAWCAYSPCRPISGVGDEYVSARKPSFSVCPSVSRPVSVSLPAARFPACPWERREDKVRRGGDGARGRGKQAGCECRRQTRSEGGSRHRGGQGRDGLAVDIPRSARRGGEAASRDQGAPHLHPKVPKGSFQRGMVWAWTGITGTR